MEIPYAPWITLACQPTRADAPGHGEMRRSTMKKKRTSPYLVPTANCLLSGKSISWQIFLTDNRVIKKDLQVYLLWGRKSDRSDYELHQEECTVWASFKIPSSGDSQLSMIYAPNLPSEVTLTRELCKNEDFRGHAQHPCHVLLCFKAICAVTATKCMPDMKMLTSQDNWESVPLQKEFLFWRSAPESF